MTLPDYMLTKPPEIEVTPASANQTVSERVVVATYRAKDLSWSIQIMDSDGEMFLTGPEAAAVAEFIGAHTRKRW